MLGLSFTGANNLIPSTANINNMTMMSRPTFEKAGIVCKNAWNILFKLVALRKSLKTLHTLNILKADSCWKVLPRKRPAVPPTTIMKSKRFHPDLK